MNNTIVRSYCQPAFLICVVVLALASTGMSYMIDKFGVYLKKEPLKIKKSLDLLNEDYLEPYIVLNKSKIENEEVLKSLGTEDYIQWLIEDPQMPEDSPMRQFVLFITYYELPDQVPHVPEECYAGSGFQKLSAENVALRVKADDMWDKNPGSSVVSDVFDVKARYIIFGKSDTRSWRQITKPVLYFFKVNGEYAGSREQARVELNKNIFNKYSYFSKIEIIFNPQIGVIDQQQAMGAGEKILRKLLPVLEKEHWPDWNK